MEETEKKVPINITIAGYPMALEVALQEQDLVRDTEKRVNAIFSDWQKKYPRKTAAQLLAMLTFRFASFYYSLRERDDMLASGAEKLSASIAALLGENR